MIALLLTTYCAFVLIMAKGLSFPLIDAAQPILIAALLLIIGEVRPYFRPRLRAVAYLVVFSAAFAVLMDASVAHYSTLYDDYLIAADSWLGFHVAGVGQGPWWMRVAYFSFMPQIALAIWMLDSTFIRRFVCVALASVVCVILFPCRGNYTGNHGLETIACHFDSLQAATVVTWRTSQGILTMPSVHTATAILLVVGFLRTRLFLPVLLLNIVMLLSCIPVGRHYVVDLIAGAVVALAAIYGIREDSE